MWEAPPKRRPRDEDLYAEPKADALRKEPLEGAFELDRLSSDLERPPDEPVKKEKNEDNTNKARFFGDHRMMKSVWASGR